MHLESDEMHTRFLFTIGKPLIRLAYGGGKPPKTLKKKEFLKFINPDK
jgi:hypothetical protein